MHNTAPHIAAFQAAFTVLRQQNDQKLSLQSLAAALEEIIEHPSTPDGQKDELRRLQASLLPFSEDATQIKDAEQAIEDTVSLLEQVVDAIFTTVEKVKPVVKDAGSTKALNTLIEACSFQDITGQRLRKIQSMLKQLRGETTGSATKARLVQQKAGLLDGPAASGEGISQDDIDKLF